MCLFQIINVVTAGLVSWFMMTDVASFGLLLQCLFVRRFYGLLRYNYKYFPRIVKLVVIITLWIALAGCQSTSGPRPDRHHPIFS